MRYKKREETGPASEKLDKIDRKYLGDAITILIVLLITMGAYMRFQNPSVLFAGSLAITFFVTANILMSS